MKWTNLALYLWAEYPYVSFWHLITSSFESGFSNQRESKPPAKRANTFDLEVADKPWMGETIGLIGPTKSYGSGLIDLEPALSVKAGVPFILLQQI